MDSAPQHRLRPLVLTGFIVGIMACRFIPYALASSNPLQDWLWGFTPLWAAMLFGVAHFRPLWLGWAVPLAAMLLSDVLLHFSGLAPTTLTGRLLIYGLMLAIGGMGLIVRRWRTVPILAGAGLASSLLFFLTSNFLVWLNSSTGVVSGKGMNYEPTLAGLMHCYAMALPFLRNDLLGTGFFCLVLFGGFALVERGIPAANRTSVEPA